jgi:hypothetical protein
VELKFPSEKGEKSPRALCGRDLSVGASRHPHDKISFSIVRGPVISEKCAQLYASGLSLEDVGRELGIVKSCVLKHLRRLGVSLRPSTSSLEGKTPRARNYAFGNPPYGYAIIRSRLVEDPREMEVVRKMLIQWNSGASFCSIAKTLNANGHKTRCGGRWMHATISAIIRRELEKRGDATRVASVSPSKSRDAGRTGSGKNRHGEGSGSKRPRGKR